MTLLLRTWRRIEVSDDFERSASAARLQHGVSCMAYVLCFNSMARGIGVQWAGMDDSLRSFERSPVMARTDMYTLYNLCTVPLD